MDSALLLEEQREKVPWPQCSQWSNCGNRRRKLLVHLGSTGFSTALPSLALLLLPPKFPAAFLLSLPLVLELPLLQVT